VTQLFAPVVSITPTQRRRYLWAAWWTEPPEREPFRKPDASSGGAKTREEAKREAEKAAGRALLEIEPRWARAWARVMAGQAPWVVREVRPVGAQSEADASIWAILGLQNDASVEAIKAAYKQKALVAHPDQGGDPAAFRRIHQAYRKALLRRKKKPFTRKARAPG